MTTRTEILRMLSDGAFHSGTDLGKKLGITRAAVCKNIHHLAQSGLEVHRVTGRGYKLEAPFTLLDRARLLKLLGNRAVEIRDRLHLVDEVDSTNRYLDSLITGRPNIDGATCVTECQSGGRGRRGRSWVSTPYCNLMLSMAWQFPGGPGLVSGLSLAAGVVVVRALQEYGVSGVGLKWPNDVISDNRKLAGLLVDVQGEASGPTRVILGLGVNAHISREDASRIDQPWIDLQGMTGEAIDRNRLAAIVIRHLLDMFQLFAEQGFGPFRADWQKLHLFHGQRVRVLQGEKVFIGIAEGVDESGGLVVRQARNRQVFHSGEVSLRPS
ncbi:MAG: bifunctional biotin--[acetyl-CoA-carboxylase] ligase/biotin operon repressor BirA [Gammaproteobacteria bacterium]|nr:bifunctional biotin--[acetyl-CoA-carboxylase] ligase/biotin operon repressor BirA [Gammaproteobacteria bacterium]MDH3370150.1 bifunctional biotin--[acetyl-CoA-carboxylase] ligase/biotin operon repressor BirA [Gammaproteobacteria bacterium]MDH3407060.1 bifunctional biotin--[acetyl-CoA-carboxylase] ligase/biotin operon repressor BirA [Gammaproteobacteria bacterium]MDH3562541.1 bifunctional biotin--[acetyl-CoA-carboxylase] ligase/biotin operon repressor BirA [Gammaproteobacteria bacterium]MDH54